MKDKTGNPEKERRANFYQQPWCNDAVPRYFYAKVMCDHVYHTYLVLDMASQCINIIVHFTKDSHTHALVSCLGFMF